VRILKLGVGCLALLSVVLQASVGSVLEPVTPGATNVIPAAGSARFPEQVACDPQGTVHVAFRILENAGRRTPVYYCRRSPDGTWSAPVKVSEAGRNCGDPAIAWCSERRVLIAWIDTTDRGRYSLVVRCSEDDGKSWTTVLAHPSVTGRTQPRIGANKALAYVCFSSARTEAAGSRLYFYRSQDAGRTWSQKDLDFSGVGYTSSEQEMLLRGDEVWLAWRSESEGKTRIAVNRSVDRGETWLTAPVYVSDDRPGRPSLPSFGTDGEEVSVFWRASYPGSKVVFYEDRSKGGDTWGEDTVLYETKVTPVTHKIARLGNDRYLLWIAGESWRRGPRKLNCVKVTYPAETTPEEAVIWTESEIADFSELDVKVIDKTLYLATIGRFGRGDFRVLLLSRNANGEDQRWIIGGGDQKERSSLALVPFGSNIGCLWNERRARMLPMESPNGSLVFGRLAGEQ